MVSLWLASIGINDNYIKTLHEQEVNGKVLLKMQEHFLKETGMKSGPAHLIIESRNELVKAQKVLKQKNAPQRAAENTHRGASFIPDFPISTNSQIEKQMTQEAIIRKRDVKPRPFGQPLLVLVLLALSTHM